MQASESRFFLCKKYELLLHSLDTVINPQAISSYLKASCLITQSGLTRHLVSDFEAIEHLMGQGNTQRYCTHLTQDSCVLHTSHSRLLCTAHISLKTLVYCTHLTQDSCVRTHLTQDSCVLHTSHSRLLCTNTSHSRLLCTAHISLKTLVYCTHLTQDSCVLHTSHSRLLCTNTYLKGSMEERCMYLFVAIFQVAWNPLKLGMPALLM